MQAFESSCDLWNVGVVPLGRLVSESAYTKLIVSQLIESETDKIIDRMIKDEFAI